ncbi:hypothetical protein BFJ69_g12564 [Fusarium oxysporum]|uniref:Uncharacterized protein n=1 Tax=Fusarium oxysporum TaxID=5507 RepID=A0A420MNM7_FUSOX|nr:hypothetical protein BFJ69_g12564 [Fusarium oxysporum]
MVSNEFQESMARNHFDASSVEGSASGGWGGYSVGVTGGAAKEDTSGGNKTKKSYTKRMIGSYMFPRVDVFLRPEDLEPTEELRAALDGIKQTKNPFGAKGNAKGSKESQDSAEAFNRSASTSESMGFEATGGNSILAADPPAWSGSVANFNNWRIIEQTELTPIVDTISKMAGYHETRSWFFPAVPKLSEYMVITESRMLHVRFKVASQNESFGVISHKKDIARTSQLHQFAPIFEYQIDNQRSIQEWIVWAYWRHDQDYGSESWFLYHSTLRAKQLGTKTDEAFSHVVWRLEIARGHSIGSDTLLCVKSAAIPKADLALTVYRNAQGVFLPSISSTDEPCYWRLEPVETSGISKMEGDRYKFGNSFRLTWSFSDHTSGFRDFVDDSYGRRNLTRPSEIKSDKLCFKVPFPRFEGMLSDYMAVLMSTALTTDPIIEKIKVLDGYNQEKPYNLHDLSFRVDMVGNDGNGDKNDYANLTATSWQELDQKLSPGGKLLGNMLGPSPMLIDGVLGDMEFTRW